MTGSANRLDVIDVEVFRKSLENITGEMAITLMRASGSSVVTDTRDFCTALFDADAEQLAFSGWVTFFAVASQLGVEATAARYGEDPKLARGDAFVVSDPYTTGAPHQADVGIVMPLFREDEVIGWAFCAEHVLDVGGIAVGGSAPSAHDVWSEALRFPPVKIAPGGELDPGWEDFIATSVRVPMQVINDIRSMIAACNTAQRKLDEMVDRYGVQEYKRLSEVTKELSEQALREKVLSLPDGSYSAEEWIEFDGHGSEVLLRVEVTVTVDGDKMTIAVDGDPQIDALVNGAHGGVGGCIASALFCMLTYDIPVNQGIWRHLAFDYGPEGTVVNPTPPAPVSQSHMAAGFRAGKAFNDVLAQICSLADTDELRSRVAGAPQNSVPSALLFGMNQFDRPTVSVLLATAIGVGGGAQSIGDGQDCYAAQSMQGTRMPDVEVFEGYEPALILYRRLTRDSGGPGRFRGGLGMEEATVLRSAAPMTGVVYSHCDRVPPRGFAGGLPGGADLIGVVRGTDALERFAAGEFPALDAISGEAETWPSISDVKVSPGDVVVMVGGGGGGLGDPLLREPARVGTDVREDRVSPEVARAVYGVVLGADGGVDEAASAELRATIRRERVRRGGGSDGELREPAAERSSAVVIGGSGTWQCSRCEAELGAAEENWRAAALEVERGVVEAAGERRARIRPRTEDPPVVEREYICPSCGSLLAVDIALEGGAVAAAPRRAGAKAGA
ncbi:MAG: hydantoinase B/oxoprolinase family protein [Solirubrobacterales bacterium]